MGEVRQAEVVVQLVVMATKAVVVEAEAHFHGRVFLLTLYHLRWT